VSHGDRGNFRCLHKPRTMPRSPPLPAQTRHTTKITIYGCSKKRAGSTTRSSRRAVRIVRDTGKPIAQIARDLGVHEGTLGNWVAKDRAEREGTEGLSMGDAAELKRLRAENAQLRMERDVLKRSVVLWVKEATK